MGRAHGFDGNVVVKVVGVLQRRDKDELVPGGPDDRAFCYTTAPDESESRSMFRKVITRWIR